MSDRSAEPIARRDLLPWGPPLLAVVGLLVLSLGLPWTVSADYPMVMTGPLCTADLFGGGIDCVYGAPTGTIWVEGAAVPGSQTVVRVFVVAALALLLWRRTVPVARLAVLLLLVGVLVTGIGPMSGQITALAAAALLALLVHRGRRASSVP